MRIIVFTTWWTEAAPVWWCREDGCETLPTDVASPCVHCFREAGSCVSAKHAYLYTACVFLVYAHAYFS